MNECCRCASTTSDSTQVTHQQKRKRKIDASVLLRSYDNSTHALQKQQRDILQGERKTFDGNDLWYLPGVTPERLARSCRGPHKPRVRGRCFRCRWCRTDETFFRQLLGLLLKSGTFCLQKLHGQSRYLNSYMTSEHKWKRCWCTRWSVCCSLDGKQESCWMLFADRITCCLLRLAAEQAKSVIEDEASEDLWRGWCWLAFSSSVLFSISCRNLNARSAVWSQMHHEDDCTKLLHSSSCGHRSVSPGQIWYPSCFALSAFKPDLLGDGR